MKKLTDPQSGKLGNIVAFKSRYGQVERANSPANRPPTQAQLDAWKDFGKASAGWNQIPEDAREAWRAYGRKVRSHPRGGQSGPLTGNTLFTAINRNQAALGLPPFIYPPERPAFEFCPVVALRITKGRFRVSLKLTLSKPPAAHLLVFGARPLNAGRLYCDKFLFLGPPPAPKGDQLDITVPYLQKCGPPWLGSRVILHIQQQINGWRDIPRRIEAVFLASEAPAPQSKHRRRPSYPTVT